MESSLLFPKQKTDVEILTVHLTGNLYYLLIFVYVIRGFDRPVKKKNLDKFAVYNNILYAAHFC